ncbi:hypothetical protein H4R99_004919 [Coemansia sp. RSA 1722]|nr:hypothetical protein LPJ57_003554 [Coemansia sp. RSA 486]KAJ2596443.1 hypothetical protein H4R99_004919 [Coemansia sp. RSA 1722]
MFGFLPRVGLVRATPATQLARNLHYASADKPTRHMRKRALLQNDKMVGLLGSSAHKHDIQAAWYWYQRLLRRLRQEKKQTHATSPRVLSRQQDRSVGAHNIYSPILSALSIHTNPLYGEQQLNAIADMVHRVVETLFGNNGRLTGNELVAVINVFAAAGKQEMVDQIWQWAALSRMPRDTACYNAYAGAKIRAEQYDRAFDVIREISTVGLQPNTFTRVLLIKLYGLTGDLNAARRVFEFAQESVSGHAIHRRLPDYVTETSSSDLGHCGPSVALYNEMINVFGMNGLMDEMRELFLKLAGLPPSISLDQITQKDVLDARKLDYRRIRPDQDTFHALIRWHARYWDVDMAERYLRLMPLFKVEKIAKSFLLIVTPDNAQRNLQKCVELVAEMRDEGMEVSASTVGILQRASEKIAEMEEMVRISMGQKSTVFGQQPEQ